jgi:hypothetical protein
MHCLRIRKYALQHTCTRAWGWCASRLLRSIQGGLGVGGLAEARDAELRVDIGERRDGVVTARGAVRAIHPGTLCVWAPPGDPAGRPSVQGKTRGTCEQMHAKRCRGAKRKKMLRWKIGGGRVGTQNSRTP